jgi:hypothetical protein
MRKEGASHVLDENVRPLYILSGGLLVKGGVEHKGVNMTDLQE